MLWGILRNAPFVILGMLMLPKTICYLAMIYAFYKATVHGTDAL